MCSIHKKNIKKNQTTTSNHKKWPAHAKKYFNMYPIEGSNPFTFTINWDGWKRAAEISSQASQYNVNPSNEQIRTQFIIYLKNVILWSHLLWWHLVFKKGWPLVYHLAALTYIKLGTIRIEKINQTPMNLFRWQLYSGVTFQQTYLLTAQ